MSVTSKSMDKIIRMRHKGIMDWNDDRESEYDNYLGRRGRKKREKTGCVEKVWMTRHETKILRLAFLRPPHP